ncbi:MAG: hypothetical protein AAGH90_06740 [Pseudomonadota bacterium]
MKPMISSLSALVALFVVAAPMAHAQSCAAKAASLLERQTEAKALADARLDLVDAVEAAGDAWENAEAMRHFSSKDANEADATKIKYETLKADLMDKEVSLQALVMTLNEEVAAYNATCVDS